MDINHIWDYCYFCKKSAYADYPGWFPTMSCFPGEDYEEGIPLCIMHYKDKLIEDLNKEDPTSHKKEWIEREIKQLKSFLEANPDIALEI